MAGKEKSSHPEFIPRLSVGTKSRGAARKLHSVHASTSFAPTRNVRAHYAKTDSFGIGKLVANDGMLE